MRIPSWIQIIMDISLEQPKPSRYSVQYIDTNTEKFVGLKRSYSTFSNQIDHQFTLQEEVKLKEITDLFEKQLKNIKNETLFISCTICMEQFNEKQRCPKVLSCGHTLCLKCLKQLQQQLKCPTCRQTISKQAINQIPNNFQILDIIGKINQQRKSKAINIHCETHPDQEIAFYDQNSYKLYCNQCGRIERKEQFSLNRNDLIPAKVLYNRLHKYWKKNAKDMLKLFNKRKLYKCPIQDGLEDAIYQAQENVIRKKAELIYTIEDFAMMRLLQIQIQGHQFTRKYQAQRHRYSRKINKRMQYIIQLNTPSHDLLTNKDYNKFVTCYNQLRSLNILNEQNPQTKGICLVESSNEYKEIQQLGKFAFELKEINEENNE